MAQKLFGSQHEPTMAKFEPSPIFWVFDQEYSRIKNHTIPAQSEGKNGIKFPHERPLTALTFPNPTFLPSVHEGIPQQPNHQWNTILPTQTALFQNLKKPDIYCVSFATGYPPFFKNAGAFLRFTLLIIHIFQVIFSTLNISQLLPTSQLHRWVWQSHPMLPQQPYEAVALLPHSHEDQNSRSFGGALEHLPTGFPGFRRTGMGSFQWMVDDGGMVLSDRDSWWWMTLKLNRLMMV